MVVRGRFSGGAWKVLWWCAEGSLVVRVEIIKEFSFFYNETLEILIALNILF